MEEYFKSKNGPHKNLHIHITSLVIQTKENKEQSNNVDTIFPLSTI